MNDPRKPGLPERIAEKLWENAPTLFRIQRKQHVAALIRAELLASELVKAAEALTDVLGKHTYKGREDDIQIAWEETLAALSDLKGEVR